MFITKTDAWDTHDITGLGQVTIGIPALGGARAAGDSYSLTQDIALAEARGSFSRAANKTSVSFSSFVADTGNLQVTELTVTSPQTQVITVRNMVYNLTVGRNGMMGGSVGTGGGGPNQHAYMWGLRVDDSVVGTGLRAGLPLRMSLVTNVHTDHAAATTSTCNNGGALCDGAPPRPGHPPDHSRCQCTQTIQLPAGTNVLTVTTSAASIFNLIAAGGKKGTEVASAAALLPNTTDVAALRVEHRAWWSSYWNASSISLPSHPILENYFYRSLYLLGSAARATSLVPPGLCGAWFAGSGPSRYGDFTLNYNFQAIWYGAYSTNHADTAMPYYRAILDYANGPGLVDSAHYNCSAGTHLPGHIAPFGYGTCGDMQQHSDASFSALGFVRHYEMTRNATFLRDISYPFLKKVAAWWNCWLQRVPAGGADDYVLRDAQDCARESCCVGFPCTQGPTCPTCRVMTTNPTQSITFIIRIVTHLIEAAAVLRVDADLSKTWSELLAHMPKFSAGGATAPFPLGRACPNPNTTACPPGGQSCPASSGPHCNEGKCPGMVECSSPTEAGGTTVLLPQESPFYFKPGDNPLQLYAAWPGEQLSLSSPPALLKIARDTVELSDCWNEGNAPPEVYPAAVRIGFDTEALIGNLTATLRRFLAENGQVQITFPMEGLGTVVAITDMLLQSHEGFLRIFPVIRHNESAAFEDLRASGAFLVSATFEPSSAGHRISQLSDGTDGSVHDVRVKSEVGGACSILSPWTGGAPVVVANDGSKVTVIPTKQGGTPGVFSFLTVAGTQYTVSPPATAKPPPKPLPNGPMFHFDCADPAVPKGAKFCDHTLDADARVDDILARVEASHPDGRGFFSLLETAWGANAQLGIPAHNVRLEALHGMGGAGCWNFGNGTTRCPTIFPGGGSLGASFNRTNWEAVGSAISDEIRAYANLNQSMQQSQGQDIFSAKGLNDGRGVGVTEWGPSLSKLKRGWPCRPIYSASPHSRHSAV